MLTYKELRQLKEDYDNFHVVIYGEKCDDIVRGYYGTLNNDIISDNTPKNKQDEIHITEFIADCDEYDDISRTYYWQDLYDESMSINTLIELTKNKSDNDIVEFDGYKFEYDYITCLDEDNEIIVLDIVGELHNDAPIMHDYDEEE